MKRRLQVVWSERTSQAEDEYGYPLRRDENTINDAQKTSLYRKKVFAFSDDSLKQEFFHFSMKCCVISPNEKSYERIY